MAEPISSAIPHKHLVDEICISLIPIQLQIPPVHALIKWLASMEQAGDNNITHPIHWMVAINPKWEKESGNLFVEKISCLSNLQQFINDIETPLIKLMEQISDFSKHKEVQAAIYNLQQTYSEIPYIETEVALLSNNDSNILEQQDLLPTLMYYLEKVSSFIQSVENVKRQTLQSAIHDASCHFFQDQTNFYLPSDEYGNLAQ